VVLVAQKSAVIADISVTPLGQHSVSSVMCN